MQLKPTKPKQVIYPPARIFAKPHPHMFTGMQERKSAGDVEYVKADVLTSLEVNSYQLLYIRVEQTNEILADVTIQRRLQADGFSWKWGIFDKYGDALWKDSEWHYERRSADDIPLRRWDTPQEAFEFWIENKCHEYRYELNREFLSLNPDLTVEIRGVHHA